MDVTPEDVVAKLQLLYPQILQICVLTAVNEKQASRITELENTDVSSN